MKVLELCLSPSFGGLEIYVCRVAEALAQEHALVAVTRPESPIDTRLRKGGHSVRSLSPKWPRLPLRAAGELARSIDELEIDLVHVNWGPDLPLAALAKRRSRRKPVLVYTRHMLMNRSKQDPYHHFVYGQFDCVHAISAHMEQGLRKHLPQRYADRVRHLYCGVPAPDTWLSPEQRAALRTELGFPQEAFVAGVFSRLEPAKGQHLLLEALAALREQGATLHGLIVGHSMDADYTQKLHQQASQLGLEGQVVFRDFVDQPQRMMQACDCLVLPTDRETFANIVSEAMRAEVPVITSDRGGMPEMVDHGKAGLLFESENPAALAEQLRQLHDHPKQRTALATAGRLRADEHFSSEKQIPRLMALFGELVSAKRTNIPKDRTSSPR